MSEETAESVLSPNQLPPRHYYRVAGVGVVTVCVLIVVATALLGTHVLRFGGRCTDRRPYHNSPAAPRAPGFRPAAGLKI